jgi:hypothetical protein
MKCLKTLCFSSYALAFLMCFGIYLPASAGQLDKIRETKEITIAHREASIPFSYFDDKKTHWLRNGHLRQDRHSIGARTQNPQT